MVHTVRLRRRVVTGIRHTGETFLKSQIGILNAFPHGNIFLDAYSTRLLGLSATLGICVLDTDLG